MKQVSLVNKKKSSKNKQIQQVSKIDVKLNQRFSNFQKAFDFQTFWKLFIKVWISVVWLIDEETLNEKYIILYFA